MLLIEEPDIKRTMRKACILSLEAGHGEVTFTALYRWLYWERKNAQKRQTERTCDTLHPGLAAEPCLETSVPDSRERSSFVYEGRSHEHLHPHQHPVPKSFPARLRRGCHAGFADLGGRGLCGGRHRRPVQARHGRGGPGGPRGAGDDGRHASAVA